MDSTYKPGGAYVMCQRTGFKVRKSDTVIEPRTRLRVHKDEVDGLHPLDRKRGFRDKQVFRGNVSEPADRFLGTNDVQASDL